VPTDQISLVDTWSIEYWGWYGFSAAMFALAIRIMLSAWKSCERNHGVRFRTAFAENFMGRNQDPAKADHWTGFGLGFIELLSYPVLMVQMAWTFIGFWLGLKAVLQWTHWQSNRLAFNRFLIGNGLVLVLSLLLAQCYVESIPEDQQALPAKQDSLQHAQAFLTTAF